MPTSFFGKLFGEAVQRYSPAELAPHAEEFQKQLESAASTRNRQ